jgi:alkanesulfonate monooxygenase SsuD/methylene tetrahydromethanopterin reductase-like flavin-dependent oxidoreductase (luciferase family)
VQVGIGMPTGIPGATRQLALDWARSADVGPFSSLGVTDRVRFHCWEALLALSVASAVTARIRLATMVLIGPLRPAALLAKQAHTLQVISGGRLILGLGLGARHDDYEAVRVAVHRRGLDFSRQLVELRDEWAENKDASDGSPPPPVLVGGGSGAAFERMARYADGYAHGGGPPRAFASAAGRARAAWADLGRPGVPRLWGQGYFALGDEATVARGSTYLRSYYAFTGPFADRIVAAMPTSTQSIKDLVRGYEDEGCEELVLFPTVADLEQVERLAQAIG